MGVGQHICAVVLALTATVAIAGEAPKQPSAQESVTKLRSGYICETRGKNYFCGQRTPGSMDLRIGSYRRRNVAGYCECYASIDVDGNPLKTSRNK